MPVRVQRKRTKGWKMPPNTVYVGRPSKWGNPFDFRREEFCWIALSYGCRGDGPGRREASIRAYRDWVSPPHGRKTILHKEQPKMVCSKGEINLGPEVTASEAPNKDAIIEALGGKNLACYCALDQPCHADVLLEIANRPVST